MQSGKITSKAGFTLLEVLLALAVTGIIVTSVMSLYLTQHKNYLAQDDITVIQQSTRASLTELVRSIRMAGRKLPGGMEPLVVTNSNPDTLTIYSKTGECDTYLSSAMPQPSAELKCGSDVSCFKAGQWVYIYEPAVALGEWFLITHVQAAAKHIQHNTMPLSRQYGASSIIVGLEANKYFVDNLTDPEHPMLMIQPMGAEPQPFAEDIVDLQFQFRLTDGSVVDTAALAEDIREVLIEVTGRSHNPDYENEHEPYRFRSYAGSVGLRNIGN